MKRLRFLFLPALLASILAISISAAAQQAAPKQNAEPVPPADPAAQTQTATPAQGAPESAETPPADDGQTADAGQAADAAATQSQQNAQSPAAAPQSPQAADQKPQETPEPSKQQPKRILGVMPNFRAISAGTIPPPPTPKQSFILATQNSFDYSSFIFVGFTSAFAEWTHAHAQLGEGMTGYGRYYWRGLLDKTDGNYLVLFVLPTVFHQDERYFARGKGGFWRRLGYASTRIFITPNYKGHDSFNVSELLGRGIAQAVSASYYPSGSRTLGAISLKYGYALMRDSLTSVFREFWPDIATHVLHRHP